MSVNLKQKNKKVVSVDSELHYFNKTVW